MALNLLKLSNPSTDYDVTIFQTPNIGEKKGYRPVYRLTVRAKNHQEVLKKFFGNLIFRKRSLRIITDVIFGQETLFLLMKEKMEQSIIN